ncbi:hypothetical protein HYV12_03995 [Candidatus Dojkabacteria bacterium]|nr:hypothetical protein [Candidatus Dojkabacteria bacterium]
MKKIYKYLIILAIVVTITFSLLYFFRANITQKERANYASHISEGDKFFERKEYGKALSSYALASETIPQERSSYEKIIDLLVLKRRFDDAKVVVEQSAKVLLGSNRAYILRKLALAYYKDGQYEKAEKYLLNADQIKSTDEGFLLLGKVYLKMNDTTKANKFLGKVNTKEGATALERDLLKAYLKKSETSEAKSSLEVWDLSLEEDKDLTTLVTSYLRAINGLGKDDLYNRTLLAREYINSGYPVIAVEILESELDKMKEYPDGLFFLARAYYDSGKYSSSLDILNRSLGLNTFSDEIYLLIARINLINGDQNTAFDSYEKAISFAGTSKKDSFYKEYLSILLQEKSYSELKSNLDKIIKDKVTENLWPYFMYIEMYYDQKNYVQMQSVITTVSKMANLTDAEKMEYLNWQIVYDIENDKLASAKELLTTLRSLDRFNPNYYLLSGRVNLIEGNQENAKEDLNTAINYDLDGSVTESAKRLLGRIE